MVYFMAGALLATSISPAGADPERLILPRPGTMVGLSPAFDPTVLKGLKLNPHDPLSFDFIMDQGGARLSPADLKIQSVALIRYFLAALTVPEQDWWVNLSPYEQERIIPDAFGRTAMGRDILAQDYVLKQVTASLMYPDAETGRKFWRAVYTKAAQEFAGAPVPLSTFNKVWIMPDKAVVYENAKAGTAYVVESKLKVMLEQDYVATQRNRSGGGAQRIEPQDDPAVGTKGPRRDNPLSTQILREIIIPQLNQEVNQGKNFAPLRQVYHSLILAAWYKQKIRESILAQVYADQNKVAGLLPISEWLNGAPSAATDIEAIYQRYLEAFKKGVYNFIKEEPDPVTQQRVPRKYFSGGATFLGLDRAMTIREAWAAGMEKMAGLSVVKVVLRPAGQARDKVRTTVNKFQRMREVVRMFRGKGYDEAVTELLIQMARLPSAKPGPDGKDRRVEFIEAVGGILGDSDPLSVALRQFEGGDFAIYFYRHWNLPEDKLDALRRKQPYRVVADKPSAQYDVAAQYIWQKHVTTSMNMLSEANAIIGPHIRDSILRLTKADLKDAIKPLVPLEGWRFSISSQSGTRLVNGVFRTAAVLALATNLTGSMPHNMFDPQQRELAALDQSTVLSRIIDETRGWSSTQWEIHSRAAQAQSIVNDIREKYPPQRVRAALDAFPHYQRTKATDIHDLFWNVFRPYMAYQPGEAGILPGEILEKVDRAYHDIALNEALKHFLTARRDGKDPEFRLGFFQLRQYFVPMNQFIMGMFSQDGVFLMAESEIRAVVKIERELLNTRFPGGRLDPFGVFVLAGPYGYPRPSYAGMTYPVRDLPAGTPLKTTDYYAIAWEDRNAPSNIPWGTAAHEAGHAISEAIASQRGWRVPNTELEALLSELILVPVDERFEGVFKHLVGLAGKNDVYGLASQSILRALAKANGMEWRTGLTASAFDHVPRPEIRRQAQALYSDKSFLQAVPPGKGELEYDDLTAGDGKAFGLSRKWFAYFSTAAVVGGTGLILYYLYRLYRKSEEKKANERAEAESVDDQQGKGPGTPLLPRGVDWDEPSLKPFLEAIIHEGNGDAPQAEKLRGEIRAFVERYYLKHGEGVPMPEDIQNLNPLQKALIYYLLAFPQPLNPGLSVIGNLRNIFTSVNGFEFQRRQLIARMAKALREYPRQEDPAAYLYRTLVRIISDALEPDQGEGRARLKRLRFVPPRLKLAILGEGIPREGLERKYFLEAEDPMDSGSMADALAEAAEEILLNEQPSETTPMAMPAGGTLSSPQTASVILDLRNLVSFDGTVSGEWMRKFARAIAMAGPDIDRFLIIKSDGSYEAVPAEIDDEADAQDILSRYVAPHLAGEAYDFSERVYPFSNQNYLNRIQSGRSPSRWAFLPKIARSKGQPFSTHALTRDLQLERGDVFVVSTDSQLVAWKRLTPVGGYFQVPGSDEVFRDPGNFVERGSAAAGVAQGFQQAARLPPGMKLGELFYTEIDPKMDSLLYCTMGNFTDAELTAIYRSASRSYGDYNLLFYPYDPNMPVTQLDHLPDEAARIVESKGAGMNRAFRNDHRRSGWIDEVYVKHGADEFAPGVQVPGDFYYSLGMGFNKNRDTLLYVAWSDMSEQQRVSLYQSLQRQYGEKYGVVLYAQDKSSSRDLPIRELMRAAKEYASSTGINGKIEMKMHVDRASTSQPTGGVDLRATQDLYIKADAGTGIRFNADAALARRLRNVPGFTPEVLDVRPLSDLRGFLGAAGDG